jgi:hypothetical protein
MPAKITLFPQELIDLNMEVLYHPELQKKLAEQPADELEIRLAAIATYCGILIDGYFSVQDLATIAGLCHKELIKRRTGILLI